MLKSNMISYVRSTASAITATTIFPVSMIASTEKENTEKYRNRFLTKATKAVLMTDRLSACPIPATMNPRSSDTRYDTV